MVVAHPTAFGWSTRDPRRPLWVDYCPGWPNQWLIQLALVNTSRLVSDSPNRWSTRPEYVLKGMGVLSWAYTGCGALNDRDVSMRPSTSGSAVCIWRFRTNKLHCRGGESRCHNEKGLGERVCIPVLSRVWPYLYRASGSCRLRWGKMSTREGAAFETTSSKLDLNF